MKKKKKGMFEQLMEESRSDRDRFTRSVTEGKDYASLYDIESAVRHIDTRNLMTGVIVLMSGLLIFVLSIMLPFLMGHGFRMGIWTAIGVTMLTTGTFYYIGSYRILHPLARAVSVEKDLVIRGILKRDGDIEDEIERESEETDD